MKHDFKESACYKQGLFYVDLGHLLTNPKTTITDLAEFGFKHGVELDVKFFQKVQEAKQEKPEDEK